MNQLKIYKRIVIIVIIISIIISIGALVNNYMPHPFIPYIKFTSSRDRVPMTYIKPIRRTLYTMNDQPLVYSLFEYFSISAHLPYKIVHETKNESFTRLKLSNGSEILSINLRGKNLFDTLTQHLPKDDREKMKVILSEENVKNNYNLAQWILETSPDDLGIFSKESDIQSKMMLIPLKNILIKGKGDSIFEFSTNNIRGFQIGNPINDENSSVQIIFFDNNNGVYNIVINGKFSQKDLDYMLLSLKYNSE